MDNTELKHIIALLLEDAKRLQQIEPNAGTAARIEEAKAVFDTAHNSLSENNAEAVSGCGIQRSDYETFNIIEALQQHSTKVSNTEGEFSVFQINRAAEAAIIVAAMYLEHANKDAFQKDRTGSVENTLARASKMFTI